MSAASVVWRQRRIGWIILYAHLIVATHTSIKEIVSVVLTTPAVSSCDTSALPLILISQIRGVVQKCNGVHTLNGHKRFRTHQDGNMALTKPWALLVLVPACIWGTLYSSCVCSAAAAAAVQQLCRAGESQLWKLSDWRKEKMLS